MYTLMSIMAYKDSLEMQTSVACRQSQPQAALLTQVQACVRHAKMVVVMMGFFGDGGHHSREDSNMHAHVSDGDVIMRDSCSL